MELDIESLIGGFEELIKPTLNTTDKLDERFNGC